MDGAESMYRTNYLERASGKIDRYLEKYGSSPWKANLRFFLWFLMQPFRIPLRWMHPKRDKICRIAFDLRGGVGDIIVALNFIQNFSRFLDAEKVEHVIDLYVPPNKERRTITKVLCRGQSFVRSVRPPSMLRRDCDLHIEIFRAPDPLYINRPKVVTLSPKLLDWCDALVAFRNENRLVYRNGTPGNYIGTQLAILQGRNRLQLGDFGNLIGVKSTFRPEIPPNFRETLAKFGLTDTPFITLQRGIGGGDRNAGTRLWPQEHYEKLIAMVHERLPGVKIVQLGVLRNLPLCGVDVDLRGKTSFEELAAILTASRCHIDGECGMVHLRHFFSAGPSVVLFGPTNEHFYGYPENFNLRSDACPGGCELITTYYVRKCPRGLDENVCLTRILPETVLEKIAETLGEQSCSG